jgi:hypothetical protein
MWVEAREREKNKRKTRKRGNVPDMAKGEIIMHHLGPNWVEA